MINSGALWGLITLVVLFFIVRKVGKKRAERGWQVYGEGQIYRPDEWETKRERERKQRESETDAVTTESTGTTSSGSSATTESGSSEGRADIQTKSDKLSKSDGSGNKKSNKAGKRSSITIPHVESVEE